MATVAYLDTHVVAWLLAGFVDLLSEEARKTIEQHDVLVSPMVVLELIVAQAALRGMPLVTKDRAMRRHYGKAVW